MRNKAPLLVNGCLGDRLTRNDDIVTEFSRTLKRGPTCTSTRKSQRRSCNSMKVSFDGRGGNIYWVADLQELPVLARKQSRFTGRPPSDYRLLFRTMENKLHAARYGNGSVSQAEAAAGPPTMPIAGGPSPVTGAAGNGTVRARDQGAAGRGRSLVRRSATLFTNGAAPNPSKRLRKDRGPNWSLSEIAALVHAKRELFLEEVDAVDGRDLMNPDATKWIRISIKVMRAGFSPCLRDGLACKSKWNQIIPEYKRIADFFTRSGTNGIEYWNMTTTERKNEGLPRSFSQDIFNNIHEWFGNRPSMQPPHTRDLLSNEDNNYTAPSCHSDGGHDECNSDGDDADPMYIGEAVQLSDDTGTGVPSPLPAASTGVHIAHESFSSPLGTPTPHRKNVVSAGVTSLIVSSSDTSGYRTQHRQGNTAVRRKNLSGHNVIAEATRASGDVMAGQMRNMAEASHEIERSKIEVQLKLFTEQTDYQRERDRRLHENARLANMNARLAIEKQGQVIQCLSDLSTVLSAGLRLPKKVELEVEEDKIPSESTSREKEATTAAVGLPPTHTLPTADLGPSDSTV